MVLELNASNEWGIGVVWGQIKQFADNQPSLMNSQIYPFKLIILDEADAMTKDAQAALWRIIEKYSKTTRFCLVCNHVSGVIPALISRCTRFKFAKIKPEDAIGRLAWIAKEENLQLGPGIIEAVYEIGQGDMRQCVNTLQGLYLSQQIFRSLEEFYEYQGVLS